MDADYYDISNRLHALEKKVDFLFSELRIEYNPPAEDVPEYVRHIKELLHLGSKIEAIKVYREATGAGLGEAKTAVEQIERDG